MIVLVFDPLALTLILAANKQFEWARHGEGGWVHDEEKEFQAELDKKRKVAQALDTGGDLPAEDTTIVAVEDPQPHHPDTHPYLRKGFHYPEGWMFGAPLVGKPEAPPEPWPFAVEPAVANPEPAPADEEDPEEDPRIKAAKQLWKEQHPNDTLKHQRQLLNLGKIDELPWMKLIADNELPESPNTGFGTQFPPNPRRGDTFVRVDNLPSIVYKYNGTDWIEVDKNSTDSYTYDEAYIDHLIDRISQGEYDADLLTEAEREQVAQRLQQTNPNNENK